LFPPRHDPFRIEFLHPPRRDVGEALIDIGLERGQLLDLQRALHLPVTQRLAHDFAHGGVLARRNRASDDGRHLGWKGDRKAFNVSHGLNRRLLGLHTLSYKICKCEARAARIPAPIGHRPATAVASRYIAVYVSIMTSIGIRELQKISGEAIGALEGPTAIKSGARTVGLLIPLKSADPDRLAEVLARAEELARSRDPAADDAALAAFGAVDPIDWSIEAVRALTAKPMIP